MIDLLRPPWPYPRCPQARSIHVLLTAVKSCARYICSSSLLRPSKEGVMVRHVLSGGETPRSSARPIG